MSLKGRVARLENGKNCQECRDKPQQILTYWPREGEPTPGAEAEERPEGECCPECGRELFIVLACVYDDPQASLRGGEPY